MYIVIYRQVDRSRITEKKTRAHLNSDRGDGSGISTVKVR